MSMVAAIMARLGIDTAGFSNGLRSAERDAVGSHGRMANSARQNAAAHEDLWKSERRIEGQISNVARTMLSGASASEILSSSIEGLGKSLNLSLGSIATIGVGVMAVDKMREVAKEHKLLLDELSRVARNGGGANRPLEQIQEDATNAADALAKLRQEAGDGSAWGRFKSFFGDVARAGGNFDSTSIPDIVRQRNEGIEEAQSKLHQALGDIAQKKSGALDVEGSGEPEFIKAARRKQAELNDRIRDTGTPGSKNENQLLSERIRRELEQALLGIAESVAQKRRDRAQLTLGDLAESGPRYGDNRNLQSIYNSEQAREAQRLQAQARTQALDGDLEGAQRTLNRSDEIKRGIGTLKDSEKELKGEFMGALDASQVLQEIKENTAKPLTNQ